jgi:hypothetical protein
VEHRALVRLQEHFEALGDERFGVLRVFDYLPEERALVLEEVAAPTLSQLLALSGSRARPALAAPWPTIFRNAGAWLLECHGLPPLEHTRPRQETRDEFVALMESFAEFLAASVGRKSFFRRLVETVRAAAVESLDATLPLAMAHSDYAPNNVFVGAGGRVTVFDTTGRWQAPIYEDLGHFLVGLKAASRQVYRPGAAWRAVASPHEAPFLQGYFGSATIPWTAVRLFELEAVLDRWAGLCRGAQRSTGVRRAAKRLRLAWWSMFLGRYAARLLAEIVARPPAPSAAVPAATLQEARN